MGQHEVDAGVRPRLDRVAGEKQGGRHEKPEVQVDFAGVASAGW